jgi:Na+/proline symporter
MGFDSQLSPELILSIIAAYFLLLLGISYLTSRNADTQDFFIAGRKSPWILVAIGMIGASLSGVTFISIPGKVGAEGLNMSFSYMQVVMGYLVGYLIIGTVLMPLYYRLNLTSIYGFLEKRFGFFSYKTGAAFFLLSRTIGAAFRLFLVAIILQKFVMDAYGIPFWLTVLCTIALIWVYTSRGGIKTIVWTDTLQTVFMLGAVILTIISIGSSMEMSLGDMVAMVRKSEYSQVFFFENGWADPNNFFKQFFSGALIAIVMTGMDQDMMQKNLSCRNIREAQWNMATFSIILVFANLLFLMLGALLYIYGASIGLEVPAAGESDQLFPSIALEHLPAATGVLFVLGLIAAAYSSADSALTSLTTSFCIDFLNFEKVERTEAK